MDASLLDESAIKFAKVPQLYKIRDYGKSITIGSRIDSFELASWDGLMSIFDCDPDEFTKPIKPYRTLSHSENAKRIDAMYWRLVGKILQTAVAHLEANRTYNIQKLTIAFAEQQVADWEAAHEVTPRFSVRLHDHIYPWGTRISPSRYRDIIAARKRKLLDRIEQTRLEHDDAVSSLKKRAHLISRGRAWLKTNPSKIIVESDAKSEEFYEKRVDDAGRKSLIVKSINIDPATPSVVNDIVSLDADEIVVGDAAEGRGVRERAGWASKPARLTSRLIGDGVRFEDSFTLCGKVADKGYLDVAIGYHFFAAATRPTNDFHKLKFETGIFAKHREQITRNFVSGDASSSGWGVDVKGFGVDARYFVHPSKFDNAATPLSMYRSFQKQSKRTEPLLEKFRTVDFTLQQQPFVGRLCDPELWVREADEFEQALHALDGGNSFILTGAAGTGKTHMIPGFISWCLANGRSVKVLAGGGALDVIEARCKRFMENTYKIEIPLSWAREPNYLIFGDFDQRMAFEEARSQTHKSDILKRSKLIRPEGDEADVLVIDEATLVPFEEAMFERPQQIVVIGDLFQIARTNSVFAVAASSGIQTIRLRRNFRAINCDIMTWSNIFSYDNALVVKNRGSRFTELRYVPLGVKNNGVVRAELTAIKNAALEAHNQGESVGIVAFNRKQLDALSDMMRKAAIPPLEFLGLPENIQGKEADTVLFSFGAALTKSGRLPTVVAGLDDEQAIMKMNVALSRARKRTIVFSSLLPSDIDLRSATDAQAIVRSVCDTFSKLPSNHQMRTDPLYNRNLFA